uniref:Uncharacterized protein n=1 Tax=Parascaris equorum TaxID=6256 RepID=A0A914R4C9_PAREQ
MAALMKQTYSTANAVIKEDNAVCSFTYKWGGGGMEY